MTLLYLVRHGETEWSRSGQHTSITDLDLTDRGVDQATSLQLPVGPGRLRPRPGQPSPARPEDGPIGWLQGRRGR